jgi:hypothetical protein
VTAPPRFVGIQPWFPLGLNRWSWLTEAVPAERVAALRIAAALAVLADLFGGYFPHYGLFFSPEAVGGRDLFADRFRPGHLDWSVLRVLPDEGGPALVFGVWVGAAVALLIGWRPLLAGLVAVVCAVSVANSHPLLTNGGDRLRTTLFLTVAVSCSGAVWGVSAVRPRGDPRPVLVPGWPVNVLLVQLAVMYFFNGYYKILSPSWRAGTVMYYASNDLGWSLLPGVAAQVPLGVHQLLAWATLVWELGFPVLVLLRGTRAATLLVGFLFHLATFLTLEVGAFALYAMACYAVFLPWERWRRPPVRGDQATA